MRCNVCTFYMTRTVHVNVMHSYYHTMLNINAMFDVCVMRMHRVHSVCRAHGLYHVNSTHCTHSVFYRYVWYSLCVLYVMFVSIDATILLFFS